MLKAVLDTNVLVSGLLKRGRQGIPDQILRRINQFELYLSEAILQETNRVLHYGRIQQKYRLAEGDIADYLIYLRTIATIIENVPTVDVVPQDPDDNIIVGCALKAGAQYVVSGDPHLTDLKEHQGIQMVSPAEFVALLTP